MFKKNQFNRGSELENKLFVPMFQKRFRNGFSSHSSISHESQTSGIPETKAAGFQSGENCKT